MSTKDVVVAFAAEAHRQLWTAGSDVSKQTKKSQRVCGMWQDAVMTEFGSRFAAELPIYEKGSAQKIDLVNQKSRVAYELKSSPNNVHMEIYRDVFKALVFNEHHPERPLKKLVFIAPEEGIRTLGPSFPKDVAAIAARLGLSLKLRAIP